MRNVNPEWFYGWDREPVEELDLDDVPGDTLTIVDLDETLCNYEGKPYDDCRCRF